MNPADPMIEEAIPRFRDEQAALDWDPEFRPVVKSRLEPVDDRS